MLCNYNINKQLLQIIEPTTISIPEVIVQVEVTAREVNSKISNLESFMQNNSFIEKNENITLDIQLIDNSGQNLSNVGYKVRLTCLFSM